MSLNETPVTVTLPAWFIDRISEDVENEARHYTVKLRSPSRFPPETVAEYRTRMEAWKARWEGIESAISDALDAVGLL